jgi:amino acid permease
MLVFTIIGLAFDPNSTDKHQGTDFSTRFSAALEEQEITLMGIFNSLPLIIFSYMYQPNIPALYQELKRRNMKNMQKVLWMGTIVAAAAYIMTGMFGYATFATYPREEQS